LDSDKLTVLGLSNNNFLEQDLSVFSIFRQLQELYLGNYNQEKIEQGIYNKFQGSLEHLKNLINLKRLGISNTDLQEVKLEQLSKSLESINYSTNLRPNCQLTKIVSHLDDFIHIIKEYNE